MRRTATQGGASLDEIESVYRRRAIDFERIAAAIVGDREVARDVVQDAFATVVRKRAGFARRGSLDAWIWRTLVHTALNRLKAARRGQALVARLSTRDGAEPERAEDADLRPRLAALPERQRLVVFLRYYADLDYTTIGDVLGISTGTVSSTLSAAQRTLRERLSEEVPR